jgi:Holliday junction resolvase RusA-like endonuclease
MLGNIVMAGIFDLPISVNEMYLTRRTREGGNYRTLTEKARTYKNTIYNLLVSATNGPEKNIYVDGVAVRAIKKNNADYKKNKKIKRIKFHLSITCTYVNDKADVSNFVKLLEDAIFGEWLELNDNQVIDLHPVKIVDPKHPACVEVVLRECTPSWSTGDLFRQAMTELQMQGVRPGNIYSDPTDKNYATLQENPYNAITEVDLPWSAYQNSM